VPLYYRLRTAVSVTPVVTCRAQSVSPRFVSDGYRAEMAAGRAVMEKLVLSVCFRHRPRRASELPRASRAVVVNYEDGNNFGSLPLNCYTTVSFTFSEIDV
jgi:hypothetical protein